MRATLTSVCWLAIACKGNTEPKPAPESSRPAERTTTPVDGGASDTPSVAIVKGTTATSSPACGRVNALEREHWAGGGPAVLAGVRRG